VGDEGALTGDIVGEVEDEGWKRFLRVETRGFCGEYVSCHSLICAASQKASRPGLPGGVGIRMFFFEGEFSLDFVGDAVGGGVQGLDFRKSGGFLCSRGGEK